tara:strand:- start:278 stop:529 length:252 start_codon:yes stop_codon:yes gene_type:complete
MENFFTVLIEPLPIEVQLSTELKIRDIENCQDIDRLKDYAVAITKQNANHDYILGAALAKIVELEEKIHFRPSRIRKFLKKFN